MKFIKSHFWYNKRQRNGILFLLFLITTFQIAYFTIDFSSGKPSVLTNAEIDSLQVKIDSLKALKKQPVKYVIRPFNPSFLTGYKAYTLGLNTTEIDKLLAYRKKGKYLNSAKQFQRITGISDSLLTVLKPLFKFPEWVVRKQKEDKERRRQALIIKNINTVTAQDLIIIKGVGIKTANRIINYRTTLKGFSFNDQLYEVYYLDTLIVKRILKQFKIFEKPLIKKLNVNTASFKEVLHLPYIDYQLTKKIFDYKREVAEIQDIAELKKIDGFPIDKFDRIVLYLKTE
ncbi:MAG: helix-hairpin-helix domain-containing protein [Flavobacteriaceae bacterium]|nr:helix-hairpin-helix domain-containing protein [Flavobacteriaceae bacterium]